MVLPVFKSQKSTMSDSDTESDDEHALYIEKLMKDQRAKKAQARLATMSEKFLASIETADASAPVVVSSPQAVSPGTPAEVNAVFPNLIQIPVKHGSTRQRTLYSRSGKLLPLCELEVYADSVSECSGFFDKESGRRLEEGMTCLFYTSMRPGRRKETEECSKGIVARVLKVSNYRQAHDWNQDNDDDVKHG